MVQRRLCDFGIVLGLRLDCLCIMALWKTGGSCVSKSDRIDSGLRRTPFIDPISQIDI